MAIRYGAVGQGGGTDVFDAAAEADDAGAGVAGDGAVVQGRRPSDVDASAGGVVRDAPAAAVGRVARDGAVVQGCGPGDVDAAANARDTAVPGCGYLLPK